MLVQSNTQNLSYPEASSFRFSLFLLLLFPIVLRGKDCVMNLKTIWEDYGFDSLNNKSGIAFIKFSLFAHCYLWFIYLKIHLEVFLQIAKPSSLSLFVRLWCFKYEFRHSLSLRSPWWSEVHFDNCGKANCWLNLINWTVASTSKYGPKSVWESRCYNTQASRRICR